MLGDFGSGYLDIAPLQQNQVGGAGANSTGVKILRNNGTGTYGTPMLLNTASATLSSSTLDFAVGDFNADGHLDIETVEAGIIGQTGASTVF